MAVEFICDFCGRAEKLSKYEDFDHYEGWGTFKFMTYTYKEDGEWKVGTFCYSGADNKNCWQHFSETYGLVLVNKEPNASSYWNKTK